MKRHWWRDCVRRRRTGRIGSACAALLFMTAGPASAARDAPAPLAVPATSIAADSVQPARQTRIYVGMWTSHVRDPGRGLEANSLLGVAWRGWFGGTFINSYGDRAVSAGMQRGITRTAERPFTASLGYRAGIVTGYDERFLALAERTPVVPFAQLIGGIDHQRVGAEIAFAGLTASVIVSWKF